MSLEPITSFHEEFQFLSNFWLVNVSFEGKVYASVEHAYVAAKTLDPEGRRQAAMKLTPGQVKRFGRNNIVSNPVKGNQFQLRPDWRDVRVNIMLELLRCKFSTPYLAAKLIETGERELIEGNMHKDDFWGVYEGKGENHLGRLLMQVRSEILNIEG